MEQTPFVRAIIGLVGLTRLGEHPATLHRLATITGLPIVETAALLRNEFRAHIEDDLIYWDEPFPGNQTRRMLYVGDREIPMRSGCAPDLFVYAAISRPRHLPPLKKFHRRRTGNPQTSVRLSRKQA
jgi:hypothetical protein